jgi:hypothetical protein
MITDLHACVLAVVYGRSPVVHLYFNSLQYDVPTVVSMIQPLIFGHKYSHVYGSVFFVCTYLWCDLHCVGLKCA